MCTASPVGLGLIEFFMDFFGKHFFHGLIAAINCMFQKAYLRDLGIWVFATSMLACFPFAQPSIAAPQDSSLVGTINQLVAQKWNEKEVSPANRCSDETFVRRLYIDLVGRIPTVNEREAFLRDGRIEKRETLVDHLLNSEDHAEHLADLFDIFLMGRGTPRKLAQRKEYGWREWLKNQFRENRPWNEIAEKILLARPESDHDRGAVWFLYERENDYQKIAEAIAPAFFGLRIDCAQCHDSMIASEIEQAHYWGLVAFYNRGKNEMTPRGPRVVESAIGGYSEFANIYGSSSPNLLAFLDAETVDEARPEKGAEQVDAEDLYCDPSEQGEPRVPLFSRRQKFVEEVLRDHPMVAPALVNRLWGIMLGRGIVHPFDQMDSAHPPSHPQLLDKLATHFIESNYDIRQILRSIALSDAYQLDSERPADGVDPSLFTWYQPRPLTAEQLARSWQVALKQSFDPGHPLMREMRSAAPEVLPETVVTPISESLFLSNASEIEAFLDACSKGDSDLHSWIESKLPEDGVRKMFVAILGRNPQEEELQRVVRYIGSVEDGAEPDTLVPDRVRNAAWALLTSAEFRFNH